MKSTALISGLKWSFLERASVILLQLVLEVILARLLLPEHYGVLGMIMVVVAFANVFVDGGFSNALIHYQDRDEADYATVFYLSIAIGVVSYLLLYSTAPLISNFYGRDLTLMIRVVGISILFNSFGVLYRARLAIQINFKKQTLFSAASMLISGIIATVLAYGGYGVWALILQMLVYSFLFNSFLFFHHKALPRFIIERKVARRIVGFGSKIFISSIIQAVYFNAYPIVLGKIYNSSIVGLYTKGNQFSLYPAGMFSAVIQRVFFPFLSGMQGDKTTIYAHHIRFIKLYSLFAFPSVAILVIFTRSIVTFLLSESWAEIVMPLQFLLSASVFFPIIILNMNIFQVLGRSGLFLRTEVLTKTIGIVILLLTFRYGFITVCAGILVQILIQFCITAVLASRLLRQNFWFQILSVLKILTFTVILSLIPIVLGLTADSGNVVKSLLTFLFFMLGYLLTMRCFYSKDLQFLVLAIKNKLK